MGLISPCGYNQDFQPLKMSNRPLGKLEFYSIWQPVNTHSPKMRAVIHWFLFYVCTYVYMHACMYMLMTESLVSPTNYI